MQKRNDIYNRESDRLPRRRRGKHSSSAENGEARRGIAGSPGLYASRERPSSVADQLGGRKSTGTPRSFSTRHRRGRSAGMSVTNKLVITLLIVLLLGYLGVLGASLYRTHAQRKADASVPGADEGGAALNVVEDEGVVHPAGPVEEPEPTRAALAEQESERIADYVQAWKGAMNAISRSELLVERGRNEEAIEQLEQAMEEAPNVVDVQLALADRLAERQQFTEARELYLSVLESSPLKEGARLKLAETYQALHQYEAALQLALWILEGDSYLEEPNRVAALAYMAMDRTSEAIPHLRRQVAINRENIVAQNNLAVAYSRVGEHGRAVQLFQDVLDADPGNAITYYNLAVSYAQQDQAVSAVDTLNLAVEQFGIGFVSSWLGSKDFDPIRATEPYETLQIVADEANEATEAAD